jgi:hypothetical protein
LVVIVKQNDVTLQGVRDKRTAGQALGLTKFLRREPIYQLLYGFCTARRDCHPNESMNDTVEAFRRRFRIEDELDEDVVIRQIARMTQDLINEGI